MPWFEFEAKDRTGSVIRDRIEATDVRHAHHLLSTRRWFVLRLHEEGGGTPVTAPNTPSLSRSVDLGKTMSGLFSNSAKASRKQVPIKTEQMAQLLRAGMRLSEVLGVMSKRSSDPAWASIFESLRNSVVGGKPLSEAMAAHPDLFSPLFRSMVASGEASGHLVEVLDRLAKYLERREEVQQKVVGALIYPSIVLVAGVGTVIFFMVFMLPKLSDMFKDMGQALPLPTQILMWTSNAMLHYGWILILVLMVCGMFFRVWIKDSKNRLVWDRNLFRWPVIGKLMALSENSRFTQTLATLLQSGVNLVQALQVAEGTLVNTALKAAIHEARVQVREGKSLNDALAGRKLFPGLMLDMMAVGERTGDMAGALKHTADAYERDLNRMIVSLTALLEPILIVFMTVFVGSIVVSVLLAVFKLSSGIGGTPK